MIGYLIIFLFLVIRIMLHFNAKATNITPNSQLLNQVYHCLYLGLQIKKTVLLFYQVPSITPRFFKIIYTSTGLVILV